MAIIFTGCKDYVEKGDRIIATVDNFEITYGNFAEQYEKLHSGQPVSNATEEMKKAVLDDMIEQQIILFEAYRLGYDRDEKLLEFIRSKEKVLAGDLLRNQEVDGKILNEEVFTKYYQWLDKKVHLFRMKFGSDPDDETKKGVEEKVRIVYEKLQSGGDFKKLAAEYSEHATAKKDSGDMRIVSRYDIEEALFEQAYHLSEGEFSKPFLKHPAFYILKVEKIYPQNRGTMEEESQLLEKLKEYFKPQLTEQFYVFKKNIMDEHNHTLNLENIGFFCRKAGTMKAESDSADLFTGQEKKLVLAGTNFEETTIGEFLPLVFQYYWASCQPGKTGQNAAY